jgi:hypothetical protein
MPKLYGLISDESQTVAKWFTDRQEAAAALRAVLRDEPEWVEVVRVAEFDLMQPGVRVAFSLN